MVRSPWRHGEPGGNDLATRGTLVVSGNSMNGPKVASQPSWVVRPAMHPAICWKVWVSGGTRGHRRSDNPSSADNQQGRPPFGGTLRDCTPDIRWDEETVRASWRHEEVGRNDRPAPHGGEVTERAKFLVG